MTDDGKSGFNPTLKAGDGWRKVVPLFSFRPPHPSYFSFPNFGISLSLPSMSPLLTWSKICVDPALRDLPFKVELTSRGILEMSPARPRHGEFQSRISTLLTQLLPKGRVIVECPIESVEGEVRVPDVAWIERGRERYNATETALIVAPDICVEVLSWSNTPEEMTHKREFCAVLGCREFWACTEAGAVTFHEAATGERLASSALCPSFPSTINLD